LQPKLAPLEAVRSIFNKANFIAHLGIQLKDAGDGWCETSFTAHPEHLQQHGYVHAGAVTTLADHTAGGAAKTAVGAAQDVITIEFKMNFLRPAIGNELISRAEVLRAGKNIIVVEADVFCFRESTRVLVAKCISTLAVISAER
jgi:uncharacterized protein (TIGR00369 family)